MEDEPLVRVSLRVGALAALFALAPLSAHAQAAPPTFACQTRSLLVGAAEVNGMRVHCSVSGAPDGDQVLRVIGAEPLPICEVSLSNGSGDCVGSVFSSDGQHVVAVLEPSGTQFDVLPQQAPEAPPALQYTPIPPDESGGSAP